MLSFTSSKIMWLHLVNGVYCFLPKDSYLSIRPLIYPPFSSFPFCPSIIYSLTHIGHTETFNHSYKTITHKDQSWWVNLEHTHLYQCAHTNTHTHSGQREVALDSGIRERKWNVKRKRYTTMCDTCLSVPPSLLPPCLPLYESFTDDPRLQLLRAP